MPGRKKRSSAWLLGVLAIAFCLGTIPTDAAATHFAGLIEAFVGGVIALLVLAIYIGLGAVTPGHAPHKHHSHTV